MYLKIKDRIIKHPDWQTITLSGNIHNMRLQFRGKPTTAYYLCNDKDLDLSGKICTLNHYYQKGTMHNNTGRSTELNQVNNGPSVFAETLSYNHYLYLFAKTNTYNGIFFTKTITASEQIEKK